MKLIFREKTDVGDGATAFRFTPTEPITWTAGQSIRIEVPGLYGPEERRFTISGAPSGGDVVITTRPSDSEFKKALFHLNPGSQVGAYDVSGNFTWNNAEGQRVFVADGIGITPFYSMLSERMHKNEPLNASLFYTSNNADAPYLAIIRKWHQTHPELDFRHIPGQRPTPEMVHRYVPNLRNSTVYIAGRSAEVDRMAHGLTQQFQVPENRIRRDWFTGRINT